MTRKVIHIPGNWHVGQPIPVATKVGPLVTSGAVTGLDPETNKAPEDIAQQIDWAFEHVRRIMREAGGTPEDIVHMTFYVKSLDIRSAINEGWVKMFPDEENRPTRHTIQLSAMPGSGEFQIQFMAYVGTG